MSDPHYWIGRWARGEIGWHQTEVPAHLPELLGGLPPSRVFVPLCGKSLALAWLASQGHEVVGVEVSETACRAFFEEQGLEGTVHREGGLPVFRASGVALLQADFFDVTPEHLAGVSVVYDRAALIALPREVRARYAAHMRALLAPAPAVRFVQVVLERHPPDDEGPPFSVPPSEVAALYGGAFDLEWVSTRTPVDAKGPPGAVASEHVALLTRP